MEYPTTDLPHVIRASPNGVNLESDFMFVGVVYWPQRPQIFPGMYRSPIQGDAMAFSQVMVFIPRARYRCCPWADRYPINDDNGQFLRWGYRNHFDNWPKEWDLFNQNWTVKPVPSTSSSLAAILQTPPGNVAPSVVLPNLGGISNSDIRYVNTH